MHCCSSDWYHRFSLNRLSMQQWDELLTLVGSIYPLLSRCSVLIGHIFYDKIRLSPSHHPACVINSGPLLIRNKWPPSWPSAAPCTYWSSYWDSALLETPHLKLLCCWTCCNSAFGIRRITVHPVYQTGNFCLRLQATADFVMNY